MITKRTRSKKSDMVVSNLVKKQYRTGKSNALALTNRRLTRKGIMQIDYIIAVGMFIIIFALVLQYVSNYFSTVGENTNMRVMTAQATGLLSVVERGYYPENWPQATANDSSVILLQHLDNSTLDATRYGNNGTISGANCSAAVLGKLDTGCSFDGINDYISIGDSGSLTFPSEFSIALWFKASAVGNPILIGQKADGGATSAGYRIDIGTAISGSIDARVSNGTHQAVVTGPSIAANTWYHAAVTYKTNDNLNIYINGSLFNSTNTSTILNPINSNQQLTLGSRSDGGAQFFNGTIDEVIVWNRTLSADEVYNHWAYENIIDRIGLMTKAYRFYVIVNNTQGSLKNQSDTVRNLANELIKVNYTDLGIGANVPSTFVIDNNNAPIAYQINGSTVIFNASINSNANKTFTVYFDDDSNFAEQSTTMSGSDNLSEMWLAPQAIYLVQYRKLLFLNNSNYTRIKNSTQLPRDFSIRLMDTGTSATILNFGPPAPPSGNVVSFRRFTFYQNSTGAVRRGRITIQTW
ncbi:MAG: LamG domain-containing protein [Candidatus Aenigmatarchaeota archaeon]